MKFKDLPQRWKNRLRKELCGRTGPEGEDFPCRGNVVLFEDGSVVKFECSFSIVLGAEVAIFTEHCGYHIFQSSSIKEME